jgi:molybdopterin-synthase adenylyltransferase
MLNDPHAVGNELLRPDPRTAFAAEPALDLAGAYVAVLGCGSVGGLAAWCLAGAGVGRLTLADRDRLEPDNLRRHVCGARALGRPKAPAVAGFLQDRFPALSVAAHELCFLDRPEAARALLAGCEAALVAVDAEGPKHLLDTAARELGRPATYVGVYGGGWGGEVILSDAAADTPCYACATRALGRVGIALDPPAPSPGYALPQAGRPESDWPRADLTALLPCAALAVRLVLAVLAAWRGDGRLLQEFTAGGVSAWRFAVRRVPGWGGPWGLVPVSVGRLTDCPVCGPGTCPPGRFEDLLREGER